MRRQGNFELGTTAPPHILTAARHHRAYRVRDTKGLLTLICILFNPMTCEGPILLASHADSHVETRVTTKVLVVPMC